MLVRIQTVFLALAVILTGLFVKLPYAGFAGKKTEVIQEEVKIIEEQAAEVLAVPADVLTSDTVDQAVAKYELSDSLQATALTDEAELAPPTKTWVLRLMLDFRGLRDIRAPYRVYNPTWALTALVILTGLINLVAIFLYGNRKLQLRLCVFNILLTIGILLAILGYYFLFRAGIGLDKDLIVYGFTLNWTLIIPIANVFLIFQAFRFIRRDELLIQSYDRLR